MKRDNGRTWTDPPKAAPSFRAREGLDAPTAIGPDDSAAIGNALRFGK